MVTPNNFSFSLLDTVLLLTDLPDENLNQGQRGTIVHIFDNNTFEVEFCDPDGNTINCLALPSNIISNAYEL